MSFENMSSEVLEIFQIVIVGLAMIGQFANGIRRHLDRLPFPIRIAMYVLLGVAVAVSFFVVKIVVKLAFKLTVFLAKVLFKIVKSLTVAAAAGFKSLFGVKPVLTPSIEVTATEPVTREQQPQVAIEGEAGPLLRSLFPEAAGQHQNDDDKDKVA